MGRIRTTLIKRTARDLVELHRADFTDNFEANKSEVNKFAAVNSKILRNKVAGYVTKLIKSGKPEEE